MNAGSGEVGPWSERELELLAKVYEFEASRLSGPASHERDIRRVLWRMEDLLREEPSLRENEVEELLRRLEGMGQLMRVPDDEGGTRYLTRTAETVRLLGHTYEYWREGRPGVEAVKWFVELRRMPRRTVRTEEAIKELEGVVEELRSRGVDEEDRDALENLQASVEDTVRAVAGHLARDGDEARFAKFQVDTAREIIARRYGGGGGIALVAGVGSGKTYGFMMGVIACALADWRAGKRRLYLLLYPRAALAHDQFDELRKLLERTGVGTGHSRFGWFEHRLSYYENKGLLGASRDLSVRSGMPRVWGRTGEPPSVVVTTLETLKRRLQVDLFAKELEQRLACVVLDEAHLARGITGAYMVGLLRRLRASTSRRVVWVASSGTMASPLEHTSKVLGLEKGDIRLITPEREEPTSPYGMVHHVFLRPSGRIHLLGCLANATSLLIHSRRDGFQGSGERPKALGFCDNLDLLGRWNSELRENERTLNLRDREHPHRREQMNWNQRQRELPYAQRFARPFSLRLLVGEEVRGFKKRPKCYGPIEGLVDGDPCHDCRKGKRKALGELSKEGMERLGELVYRYPFKEGDKIEKFVVENPVFGQGGKVGTLDLCPFLRAGACVYFSKDDPQEVQTVAKARGGKEVYEFRDVARSRIYSSKTAPGGKEDDDVSGFAFRAPLGEVFGPGLEVPKEVSENPIPVDIVLASPSLEVGVDVKDARECIMFKAIRDVSSYRQKVGRVGREKGSEAMAVTLLSQRATDFHHCRRPWRLTSPDALDPIPLKESNLGVLRVTAHEMLWDALARHAELPEMIPADGAEFERRVKRCLKYLKEKGRELVKETARALALPSGEVEEALGRVKEALKTFRLRLKGFGRGVNSVADYVASHIRDRSLPPPSSTLSTRWEEGCFYSNLYERYRQRMEGKDWPDDVKSVLQECDEMHRRQCWSPKGVEKAIAVLRSQHRSEFNDLLRTLQDLRELLREVSKEMNPKAFWFLYQFRSRFRSSEDWKKYYLSGILEELPLFWTSVGGHLIIKQRNLYTNPMEPLVRLEWERGGRREEVPLSEALFGFVPGTWTYRLGPIALKTLVGRRVEGEGPSLCVTLREKGIHQLERIHEENDIAIYRPVVLKVREVEEKYLRASPEGVVLDGDEGDARSGEGIPVEIPSCRLEEHVLMGGEGETEPIRAYVPESASLGREDGRNRDILHPMRLLKGANLHRRARIIEYVGAVRRTFPGSRLEESYLTFRDQEGRRAGLGRVLETDAVEIIPDEVALEETAGKLVGSMRSDPNWAPSAMLAFRALLAELRCPPTQARRIASMALYHLWREGGRDLPSVSFERLLGALGALALDEERLRELTERVLGEAGEGLSEEREDRVRALMERTKEIAREAEDALRDRGGAEGFQRGWVKRALLNTLAVAAWYAAQVYCGVEEGELGCVVDPGTRTGGGCRILIYDRAEGGNGCSETIARYFYIPYVCRALAEGRGERLPAEDFLTTLEQMLLQCPRFHADMLSLGPGVGRESPDRFWPLRHLERDARRLREAYSKVWEKLGVRGRDEAWKLPLLNAIAELLAQEGGMPQRDELALATGICWNGCPECVRGDWYPAGTLGEEYVDKMVLDYHWSNCLLRAEEYKRATPEEIAEGRDRLEIGAAEDVYIEDGKGRRRRSVSLPFIVGWELDRSDPSVGPSLLMRDHDIAGPSSKWRESTSLGFGRLVWYSLLMSAYLHELGLIPEGRRRIRLAYYEVTDIPVDDTGAAGGILEALEGLGPEGPWRAGRLSDVLRWFAAKGFEVLVLVDERRAREDPNVSGFLRNLRAGAVAEKVQVRTGEIPGGAMHTKLLITPVAAIHGSPNLTRAAIERNEEDFRYCRYGSEGYRSVEGRFEDLFKGAKLWSPQG